MAGLLLMGSLVGGAARAQATASDIEAQLVGKSIYLRGGWGGKKLEFDGNGQPESTYKILSFTESGFKATSVRLDRNTLEIEGDRFGLEFDPKGEMSTFVGKGVTVEVHVPPGTDLQAVVDAIFAPDLVALVPTMPSFWQSYAKQHFAKHDEVHINEALGPYTADSQSSESPHLEEGVKEPRVLHYENPKFSDTSRAAKYSGKVLVYFVVDEKGDPTHIQVVRPAGLGLDEEAVASVSQYKFKPGIKDGKPVKVELAMEIVFKIIR